MSFFAGLAQGVQAGIPLGQAYLDAKERKRRESVLSQYGAGAYRGDQNALAQIASIDPAAAQGMGQNALAMQSNQRASQMQGVAAGLAYFHDANTRPEFEARKAAWMKTPYADLVPPDQLTFENKDRLMQMATAYTRGMAPWEIEQAKATAQQAKIERDRALAEMHGAANAAIGGARRLLPQEPPYRQPADTTPPWNPEVVQSRGPDDGSRPMPPQRQAAPQWEPGGDNVAYAYDYLKRKGMPDHIAAGLVGNLIQESGPNLNPNAVGDRGAAFGAGQWNGPRKRALEAFARERGADPSRLDVQLDFMMEEARTSESGAFEALSRAQTPAEAARIASERYWRPGDPRMANRIKYAEDVARRFGPRSQGAERARDAVVANNPALAAYAPQGPISEDQAALLPKPSELANRREALEAAGYREDSPLGRHYLLTGDVPKPDQDKLAERRRMLEAADMPEDSKAGQHYLLTGKLPSGKSIIVGADGSVTIAEGDGAFDLTKPRITATQAQIQSAEKNLAEMREVQQEMKDEYLTYAGDAKGAVGTVLDKANSETLDAAASFIAESIGSDMDAEDFKEFAAYMRTAISRVDRAFLQYRKDVTGTAGAAQELAEIKRAGLNGELSPRQFNMRLEQWIDGLESDLARSRAELQGGIGPSAATPAAPTPAPAMSPQAAAPAAPSPAPEPAAASLTGPRLSALGYEDQNVGGVTISAQEQYEFDRLVKGGMSEQEAFQRVHEKFGGGGVQ